MRRKYTESEIENFRWIGLVLLIVFVIVWAILLWFGIIATPIIFGLCILYVFTGFVENIFLAHNKKIDKYEELKLQAQLQAEADKEKIKSQIWVNV